MYQVSLSSHIRRSGGYMRRDGGENGIRKIKKKEDRMREEEKKGRSFSFNVNYTGQRDREEEWR